MVFDQLNLDTKLQANLNVSKMTNGKTNQRKCIGATKILQNSSCSIKNISWYNIRNTNKIKRNLRGNYENHPELNCLTLPHWVSLENTVNP